MTPTELDSLTHGCSLQLAALYAKGVRDIPHDQFASTFPLLSRTAILSVLDVLQSRNLIHIDETLDVDPIGFTILPSVLAITRKPNIETDHFTEIKTRLLNNRIIAAILVACLCIAGIVRFLKEIDVWPSKQIEKREESKNSPKKEI